MAKQEGFEVKTIAIDTVRTIRSISLKMHEKKLINGIRLADEEGNNIVEETWETRFNTGAWVTKQIPEGKEIIGLQCTIKNNMAITRLDFLLWKPVNNTNSKVTPQSLEDEGL